MILGVMIASIHGPFYGDALNFYGYAKAFSDSNEIISDEFIVTFQNLNVLVVSLLYEDVIQSIFINGALIFSCFYILLRSDFVKEKINILSRFDRKKYYALVSIVFLCPGLIARFGEPSREYILFLTLFMTGIFLVLANNELYKYLFVIPALLVKPIYLPFMVFFVIVFKFINTNKYVNLIIFIMALLFFIKIYDDAVLLIFYNDKISDYNGILVDGGDFLSRMLLNVFGDVNSFYTDRYSLFERIIFLSDYIWRLVMISFIVKHGRFNSVIILLLISGLFTLVNPFPHPRYLIPGLFFIAGIIAGSILVGLESYYKVPLRRIYERRNS